MAKMPVSLGLRPFSALASSRFRASSAASLAYKDTQDRQSLKVDKNEQSQSSGDVLGSGDAAFNPNRTDPRSEKRAASKDGKPMDVSAANPEVSRTSQDEKDQGREDGAGQETTKSRSPSGAGKPPKGTRA